MPVLIKDALEKKVQITAEGDFDVGSCDGWNATTYDSCVGEIITPKGSHKGETFILKPRGIAWLVSAEDYALPPTVTGITTLRTTWTKSGVMTLTSGIVDPGYSGPLSTAVINFSKTEFEIEKGAPFFRTIFLEHEGVPKKLRGAKVSRDSYIKSVKSNAKKADYTFLTIESFAKEVQDNVFTLPKTVFNLTLWALVLSTAAILIPTLLGLYDDYRARAVEREVLRNRLDYLEEVLIDQAADSESKEQSIDDLEARIGELEETAGRSDQDQ